MHLLSIVFFSLAAIYLIYDGIRTRAIARKQLSELRSIANNLQEQIEAIKASLREERSRSNEESAVAALMLEEADRLIRGKELDK